MKDHNNKFEGFFKTDQTTNKYNFYMLPVHLAEDQMKVWFQMGILDKRLAQTYFIGRGLKNNLYVKQKVSGTSTRK